MENMEKTHEKLTHSPLPRLLFGLCFPTVLSALLPPFVAVFETWLAAKIDPDACGALGVVFPAHALIQTIGFVFGTGAGSLAANALGEKDSEKAHSLGFGALFSALLLSSLFSLFGLLFRTPLLKLLGASEWILQLAKPYAACLFAAAPLMCACFVLSNLLRAEGKTLHSLVGLGLGNLLSVISASFLVLHLKAGTLGIGLSIPIGYGFSLLWLSFPYWKKRTSISLTPIWNFKILNDIKRTAINGLPSLFRQGLTVVAAILLNRAAKVFGSPALAAVAVSTRIFLFLYAIPLGIGQGMIPAVGFNYGNGDFARVKRIFGLCTVSATILVLAFSLPTAVFAEFVLDWFGQGGEELLPYGIPLLRSLCAVLPLHGLIAVTNLALQAIKRSLPATLLAAARQGTFFLPLIFFLPRAFGFAGVWLTQPLADLFTFFLAVFYTIRLIKSEEKKRSG